MMLDQATLLAGMAVAMGLALLAATQLSAYALFAWIGLPQPAVLAYESARVTVLAAVAVAIGSYVAAVDAVGSWAL